MQKQVDYCNLHPTKFSGQALNFRRLSPKNFRTIQLEEKQRQIIFFSTSTKKAISSSVEIIIVEITFRFQNEVSIFRTIYPLKIV